jgi:hypothetical protein
MLDSGTESLTSELEELSPHSRSPPKKKKQNIAGVPKSKPKKKDVSGLSAKIREEIVEHIKWGHPPKPRLLLSIAKQAGVTSTVVKQYWKTMAKAKAKNTLSQREPVQTFRMPNRNSLLRPIRRSGYTEFKHYLKSTYTCNIQSLFFSSLKSFIRCRSKRKIDNPWEGNKIVLESWSHVECVCSTFVERSTKA